jgi:hypothetical protein
MNTDSEFCKNISLWVSKGFKIGFKIKWTFKVVLKLRQSKSKTFDLPSLTLVNDCHTATLLVTPQTQGAGNNHNMKMIQIPIYHILRSER